MTQLLDFNSVVYPKILTKKNWDSEKSLLGKAQVKNTGIGDALKTAEAMHGKVDWDAIGGLSRHPAAVGNTFDIVKLQELVAAAKKEIATGGLNSYVLALVSVEKKCTDARKRFVEKKLKADVKLVDEILAETKKQMDLYDDVPATAPVDAFFKTKVELFKLQLQKLKGDLVKAADKALEAFDVPRIDQTAEKFNAGIPTIRPVTQLLSTNMRLTFGDVKPPIDTKVSKKLFDALEAMGGQGGALDKNELPDKVQTSFTRVKALLEACKLAAK